MLNRIGSAIRNGASVVANGTSTAWNFTKTNAPKAGKFIKEIILPSSVSCAKTVSGNGQAIFNQDRFDGLAKLSEGSSLSTILKIAGIFGSTGINLYTRLPKTFELFNPELFKNQSEESAAASDDAEITKKPGFFSRLFRFFFPEQLGIKGKLLYLFLLPVNIFSVIMQSVGILGFSKAFLIYLIKNISHLLEYQFGVAVQPIDEENIIHDQLFTAMCLYLLIMNGMSNVAFDLQNAAENAQKIAESIETSTFSWSWSMTLTGAIGLLSTIPVPFLAQLSTYNNLSKIPIPGVEFSETAKIAISWTSAFSAFVNHLTAKIPSTYRTFADELPESQTPFGCAPHIAMKATFYPALLADSVVTALANITAVANGIVTRVKQFNPDSNIQSTDALVLLVSGLCGGCTGLVSGLYTNEAFLSILKKMYPLAMEEESEPQPINEETKLTDYLDKTYKSYGSHDASTLFASSSDLESGRKSSRPISAAKQKLKNGRDAASSVDSTGLQQNSIYTSSAINIKKRASTKGSDRHIFSYDGY